jgi:hypothetical protein
MADIPKPVQDRWRHDHARAHARDWQSHPKEIVGAFITGGGGGWGMSAVIHVRIIFLVFIAVGYAVAGAFLPWLVAYAYAFVAAGGRVTRERLLSIEKLLTEAKAPIQADPAHPVVTLTKQVTGAWAKYSPLDRGSFTWPSLNLTVRLYAALPAGAPSLTLLTTHLDSRIDGTPYSTDGIVAQWRESAEKQPADYEFPPVVSSEKVREIECEFNVSLISDVEILIDATREPPPRPRTVTGVVTIGDHLGREVRIDVEWRIIL